MVLSAIVVILTTSEFNIKLIRICLTGPFFALIISIADFMQWTKTD